MGAAKLVATPRCGAPGLAGNTYFNPCWTNSVRFRRFTFGRTLDSMANVAATLRRRDAPISVLLMPNAPSRLRNANGSEPTGSASEPCPIWSSKLTSLSNMTMSWLFMASSYVRCPRTKDKYALSHHVVKREYEGRDMNLDVSHLSLWRTCAGYGCAWALRRVRAIARRRHWRRPFLSAATSSAK